jgi:hypothetical protein
MTRQASTVRIGCGAGFAGDRIDAAADLANRGMLDFLFFECLAERTLALAQMARRSNPAGGFNPLLERRMRAVLPGCRKHGTRIITNMGAANPEGAAQAVAAVARDLGMKGLKIAVVTGDDVLQLVSPDMVALESARPLAAIGKPMLSANAYLGVEGMVEALQRGADVVITGRVADPSLVLAPLIHTFGWAEDDWQRRGAGTLAGHLLECGFQITGGYFADPGSKDVSGLAYLGYPLADINADGSMVISKLSETGGCVTPLTVKEQLLYEVHNPAAYLTPDVTADFSNVRILSVGSDQVQVSGGKGRARPDTLKVLVGFDGGFLAETGISYAGPGAAQRAQLAINVLRERMDKVHGCRDAIRYDLIGVNALHGGVIATNAEPADVRVRAAMRSDDRQICEVLLHEMEALWIAGPAGGGGVRGQITPSVSTQSVLLDRRQVEPRVRIITA